MSIVKSSLSTLDKTSIKISDSATITESHANSGGLINVENEYISVYMDNVSIYSISADSDGGIIYVSDADIVSFKDSKIYDFTALSGSFMYSFSKNVNHKLEGSTITCNTSLLDEDMLTFLNKQEPDIIELSTN